MAQKTNAGIFRAYAIGKIAAYFLTGLQVYRFNRIKKTYTQPVCNNFYKGDFINDIV